MHFHLNKLPGNVGVLFGIAAVFGVLVTPASAAPTPAQAVAAPSFDCSQAKTTVEVAICGDPELRAGDTLMAELFAAARVSAFGKGPSNELAEQRKWLKSRAAECTGAKGADWLACLRRVQDQRNADLAVAALFRRPDLALKTLYR